MAAMDPQIQLLGKIKREITKIIEAAASDEDKLLLIEFGERRLAELKAGIAGK